MGSTRTTNRSTQRKIAKYLVDRQKEPMFPLADNLARELGDLQPGLMITQAEFERILWRLADIRAGKVKRPKSADRASQPSSAAG
jgi:hypothetical protein